jgi:hypothetical protein
MSRRPASGPRPCRRRGAREGVMAAADLHGKRPGSAPEPRFRAQTAPESAPFRSKSAPAAHRRRTEPCRPPRPQHAVLAGAPRRTAGAPKRTGSAPEAHRNAPADDPLSFTRPTRAPPSPTDSPHGREPLFCTTRRRRTGPGGYALRLPRGPGNKRNKPNRIREPQGFDSPRRGGRNRVPRRSGAALRLVAFAPPAL